MRRRFRTRSSHRARSLGILAAAALSCSEPVLTEMGDIKVAGANPPLTAWLWFEGGVRNVSESGQWLIGVGAEWAEPRVAGISGGRPDA